MQHNILGCGMNKGHVQRLLV